MRNPLNHGKGWSEEEVMQLRLEIEQGLKGPEIAARHGRSDQSVRSKAQLLGISIKEAQQAKLGSQDLPMSFCLEARGQE
jgi:hypothetical protein